MSEDLDQRTPGPGLDYPWVKQVEKPRSFKPKIKLLEPAAPFFEVGGSVLASLKGLGVTLRHLIRKPVTIQYPEQRRDPFQRFKGRHILDRHADGLEKCIGCELCAGACPADAILVIGAENTPEARFSPGERYAKVYEINYLRCIFCGLCVEACPTEALVMSNAYDLSADDRETFIFTKEQLLVDAPLQRRASKRDLIAGEEVGEFRSIKEDFERIREDAAIEAEDAELNW